MRNKLPLPGAQLTPQLTGYGGDVALGHIGEDLLLGPHVRVRSDVVVDQVEVLEDRHRTNAQALA
ncbi:MAG: hypothetical protein ACRDY6_06605 [Acidimicrobiia bacterium]